MFTPRPIDTFSWVISYYEAIIVRSPRLAREGAVRVSRHAGPGAIKEIRMSTYKGAVVQASSIPFEPVASAEKAARLMREAAAAGARLAVFPDVFIGGSPKGASFGTPVGMRKPEGRDAFRRYRYLDCYLHDPEIHLLNHEARKTAVVRVT